MQHESVWLATASSVSRPPLSGRHTADVVVIGGGITGLTAALLLREAGAEVVLLEADQVGHGSTGRSTGKVTSQHTLAYSELTRHHGETVARAYAQANQEAVELVAALAARHGIDCELERTPAWVYARDERERREVEREAAVAAALGLPATFEAALDAPVPARGAMRFDQQVQLHPARYAVGLAEAFTAAGGLLFEHSRVSHLEDGSKAVTVRSVAGEVVAARAIVATLLPFIDLGGFFAKAFPSRAYGIAVTLAAPPPEGMWISAGSPTRSFRPLRAVANGLVVVGEDHSTGAHSDTERHYTALESWTREHFAVEQVTHRWSAQDYLPADGLPFAGRAPRHKRTYVATGFRKWGLSNGTAAAMALAELCQGRDHPALDAFDATRLPGWRGALRMAKGNAKAGAHFVGDRLTALRAPGAAALRPGEGAIVKVGGRPAAVHRDEQGRLHALHAACTHVGCLVRWNDAERSWDCPCHGSRFATDGRVLQGPAVRPLEPLDLDDD